MQYTSCSLRRRDADHLRHLLMVILARAESHVKSFWGIDTEISRRDNRANQFG
jgi:hypothetical protein